MIQVNQQLRSYFDKQRIDTVKNTFIYVILYLLCTCNMLLMHYTVIDSTGAEFPLTIYDYIDNAAGIILDITLLLLTFLVITGRKLRVSMLCTYVIISLWSFSNILYSRFFNQYISWSAIKQTSNLANSFMFDCMREELTCSDLIFVAFMAVFLLFYRKARPLKVKLSSMLWLSLLPVLGFGCNVISVSVVATWNTFDHSFWSNMESRYYSAQGILMMPQMRTFDSGSLRTLAILAWKDFKASDVLSEEERSQIRQMYENHSLRKTAGRQRPNVDNIIFIIVESYLSLTSDLRVNGMEVTPYMNALKRDSNVYYNGRICSNARKGASSDGQFIYMTGLLPLKNIITVSKAKANVLPGLATLLKHALPKLKARMIIPTTSSFWSQSDMCRSYGFDNWYDATNYPQGEYTSLNDEQIFDLAIEKDRAMSGPFLSVILTMSMHMPYDITIEYADTVFKDKSLPAKLCNYLTAAHYTDKHIGRYLELLKENGLYNNSLIIITSDHSVLNSRLDTDGQNPLDIPLYIINGNIDKSTTYSGPCNQLDVYTTILDILAIDNDWLGLGHTLLNKNYTPSVNDKTYSVSERIISGNYFK